MDLHPSEDMYESFRKYQTDLLKQFDVLAEEYKFEVIDASTDVRTIFGLLRDGVSRVLAAEPLFAIPKPQPAEEAPRETAPQPADAPPAASSTSEVPPQEPEAPPAPQPAPRAAEGHRVSAAEEKPADQVLVKAAEGEAST